MATVNKASISRKQLAILQALGTDVYRPYVEDAEQAAITRKPWFDSLLSLLKIHQDDCQFSDELPIAFDPISKILTLPLSLEKSDADVKREIWQNIQSHVDIESA